MDWILQNWQFVIGSILVPVLIAIPWRRNYLKKKQRSIMNTIILPTASLADKATIEDKKKRISILFIDDDTKFKVVKILKNAGWINTSSVKDIKSLDDQIVKDTDIFFVDIQGVGRELQFNEEGLGLALALKTKYPSKKVVIYSAETKGDRFHEALRKADSFLPKNAEPYEFQQIVEQYSSDL